MGVKGNNSGSQLKVCAAGCKAEFNQRGER